jgi:hypothetical protein
MLRERPLIVLSRFVGTFGFYFDPGNDVNFESGLENTDYSMAAADGESIPC